MTSTSLRLAQHIHRMAGGPITPATREAAIRCVLDLVGSAAAGFDTGGARAARAAAVRAFGPGDATIWFAGESASAPAALLANATAAAALDVDDGVRIARGHPGAAVIPAAWTMVEDGAADADRFLRAVIAGYEAAVRVALGRLSFSSSGTWSPYGVIAAAATTRGLGPEVMANAFGIAAQSAPAMPGLAGRMGSDVKEGIPFGSVAGLAALELSIAGFAGPAQIFDEPGIFDAARIMDDTAAVPRVELAYFKPYACCRHLHAPIDAYRELAARHGFTAADVERIEVHTYKGTFNLSNKPVPLTMVEAQYSVPYCLALCALRGPGALLPMEEARLADPDVVALAARVSLHVDAAIDALFPARSPARVNVFLRGGLQHASGITDPRGDPSLPLSTGELETKLRTGTRLVLAPDHQEALVAAIRDLREGDLRPMRVALGRRAQHA